MLRLCLRYLILYGYTRNMGSQYWQLLTVAKSKSLNAYFLLYNYDCYDPIFLFITLLFMI